MSLPPVQSPAPEFSKATPPVNSPEPVKNKGDRSFKGTLDSAHNETAQKSSEHSKAGQENTAEATDTGKELPPTERVEAGITPSNLEQFDLETNTLTIQLGGEALEPAEAGEVVLLAAGIVVENIPRALQKNSTDLAPLSASGVKPDVLARLQAFVGQASGKLQPTRGVADSLALEKFDTAVLKELGKTSTQASTATSASETLNSQASLAEAKALTTPVKAELVVPTRVGSTDWGEAMAGKLTLMVNQRVSAARIHINPPELGPIEVKVNLNHDQASVQFVSQSAQVRDALEQSVPRLREMLETAGFSLADSGVSDEGQQSFSESFSGAEEESGIEDDVLAKTDIRESIGLVDDYV